MKQFLTSPEGALLIGFATTAITQLAKRFKIKPEIALSVVAGLVGILTVVVQGYVAPETVVRAVATITSAVGAANLIYMGLKGKNGFQTFDQINKK